MKTIYTGLLTAVCLTISTSNLLANSSPSKCVEKFQTGVYQLDLANTKQVDTNKVRGYNLCPLALKIENSDQRISFQTSRGNEGDFRTIKRAKDVLSNTQSHPNEIEWAKQMLQILESPNRMVFSDWLEFTNINGDAVITRRSDGSDKILETTCEKQNGVWTLGTSEYFGQKVFYSPKTNNVFFYDDRLYKECHYSPTPTTI